VCCQQVSFSYSVKWSPTTITYDDRLQRYERFPLNPIHLEIHWFSIVNSCVTVLLLTGFLATILMRVLKADFVKFSREDGTSRSCLQAWTSACSLVACSTAAQPA
jgi:hypothetical protein